MRVILLRATSILLFKSGDGDDVETSDCDSNKLKDSVSYISILTTYHMYKYILFTRNPRPLGSISKVLATKSFFMTVRSALGAIAAAITFT